MFNVKFHVVLKLFRLHAVECVSTVQKLKVSGLRGEEGVPIRTIPAIRIIALPRCMITRWIIGASRALSTQPEKDALSVIVFFQLSIYAWKRFNLDATNCLSARSKRRASNIVVFRTFAM